MGEKAVIGRTVAEKHLDLVRNDWTDSATPRQMVVARIFVLDDAHGVIVKNTTGEHYENNIFDSLGDHVRELGGAIAQRLQTTFHDPFLGPYLLVSELHGDTDCPFRMPHVGTRQ